MFLSNENFSLRRCKSSGDGWMVAVVTTLVHLTPLNGTPKNG